jgi:superfamily I DNA/RNA helicase
VREVQSALLVLGSAGSGKTRVITEKTAYLIEMRSFVFQADRNKCCRT